MMAVTLAHVALSMKEWLVSSDNESYPYQLLWVCVSALVTSDVGGPIIGFYTVDARERGDRSHDYSFRLKIAQSKAADPFFVQVGS